MYLLLKDEVHEKYTLIIRENLCVLVPLGKGHQFFYKITELQLKLLEVMESACKAWLSQGYIFNINLQLLNFHNNGKRWLCKSCDGHTRFIWSYTTSGVHYKLYFSHCNCNIYIDNVLQEGLHGSGAFPLRSPSNLQLKCIPEHLAHAKLSSFIPFPKFSVPPSTLSYPVCPLSKVNRCIQQVYIRTCNPILAISISNKYLSSLTEKFRNTKNGW